MDARHKLLTLIFATLVLSSCGGSSGTSTAVDATESVADDSSSTDNEGATTVEGECELGEFEIEMLAEINAARAESRECGDDTYPATTSIAWNCKLEQAAEAHSNDMATNNFFSHTGSDGLKVSDRVSATGYSIAAIGENIAAGYSTTSGVMHGWLNSPGHCGNIMRSGYTEVAVSRVDSTTSDYPNYWTQVFAKPKN